MFATRRHRSSCSSFLAASALLASTGCSTYDPAYAFGPPIAEVLVAPPGAPEESGSRVLVSVAGVRRAASGAPASLDVRLRIENLSAAPLDFDPQSLGMLAGDLQPFPAPMSDPQQASIIAPGEALPIEARFAFPGDGTPDSADLSALNLQWTLRFPRGTVSASVNFARLYWVRVYGPPPYGRW